MKKLNTDKLYVEFRTDVTYTLTHSDITADLFLTISLQFAYDKVNAMRDEVLSEWRINNGLPFLYVYVYVDGQFDPTVSAVRNEIFKRELPLVLEAIRYGDRKFFVVHSDLDNAPIWIHFDSTNTEYNRLENWDTPNDYNFNDKIKLEFSQSYHYKILTAA